MSVPVRISRDGFVVGADRVVKVGRGRHDDVEWIAQDNGGPWTITFGKATNEQGTYPRAAGSPFNQNVFVVPQGGRRPSVGGPYPGTERHTYRYTVSNANTGEVIDDPDVDVDP
jgi:hypothetical protein